jgi:hypothetical protein
MVNLCYYFDPLGLADFVQHLVVNDFQSLRFSLELYHFSQKIPSGFNDVELFREVQLHDLNFGHLNCKEMSPANAREGRKGNFSKKIGWISHRVSVYTLLSFRVSRLISRCSDSHVQMLN